MNLYLKRYNNTWFNIGLKCLAKLIYLAISDCEYTVSKPCQLSQCKSIILLAIALSTISLHSSTIIKNKSNLDIIGAVNWTFCCNDFFLSYRPPTGFAAANIDVRAFKVALTPA